MIPIQPGADDLNVHRKLNSYCTLRFFQMEDYESDEMFDDHVPKRQFASHSGGVYKG